MKNLILVCGLMLSLNALAGNERGNGGNAVVCRDSSGAIKSAELLDIYEGRAMAGLKYSELSGTFDQKFDQIIADVFGKAPNFGIWTMIYAIKDNIVMLPSGVELEPINDSLHILVPRNCKIEQVANFYNQKKVFINSDIYNSLNELNKLGLILHEIFYYMDRETGVTNSRYVRRSVAKLLSDDFKAEFPLNIPDMNGVYWCSINGKKQTHFLAIPQGNDQWKFQFSVLNGHRVFSNKHAMVNLSPDLFPIPRINNRTFSTHDLVSKIDGEEILVLGLSVDSMKLGWTGFDPDDKIEMETFTCNEIHSVEDL